MAISKVYRLSFSYSFLILMYLSGASLNCIITCCEYVHAYVDMCVDEYVDV